MVHPISQTQFDLLAIGTRMAMTRLMSQELSWWSDNTGDCIGVVVFDRADNDFGWVILTRDGVGRFRCSHVEMSIPTEKRATALLRKKIADTAYSASFQRNILQGDEPKKPLNLFEDRGVPDQKLHPYYRLVRDNLSKQSARKVLEAISPWLVSSDAHLVKEFQESQFDQRLWEIYLWAVFRDFGYDVSHMEAPDLFVRSPFAEFGIEATTCAPSTSGVLAQHPNPQTPDELQAFLNDYMPMKFGSALTSKLNKVDAQGRHYWEKEGCQNKPFVIAIADFHKAADEQSAGSMTYSQSALYQYLYGVRIETETEGDKIVIRTAAIQEHSFNGKNIPSGFFDLPESENVSAILFSNAGTIAKFERMGVMAGYVPPNHKYIRKGFLFDPDPSAYVGIPFAVDITQPNYTERWGDEIQVFHNPNAKFPISEDVLPDAVHHKYENGEFRIIDQPYRVLSSVTFVMHVEGGREVESDGAILL